MSQFTKKSANRNRKTTSGPTESFDLDDHLPYRIAVVGNLLALSRDAAIRQLADLPLRELRVLVDIGNYGPAKAADISRKSRKDSITVSRAVKGLSAVGMIEQSPDPADRRSPWLTLTPAGEKLYRKLTIALDQRAEAIQKVLGKREQADLIDMLRRLEQAAEAFVAGNALKVLERQGSISAEHREIIRWHKKSLQENQPGRGEK